MLVSTHPRTRKRLESSGQLDSDLVRFHEPMGFLDYSRLQLAAACVLSDSGTISEEESHPRVPRSDPALLDRAPRGTGHRGNHHDRPRPGDRCRGDPVRDGSGVISRAAPRTTRMRNTSRAGGQLHPIDGRPSTVSGRACALTMLGSRLECRAPCTLLGQSPGTLRPPGSAGRSRCLRRSFRGSPLFGGVVTCSCCW